jgi:large subunit ribosomal protein L30
MSKELEDTFQMLNLPSKFACVVLDDNPSNLGMVKKVKDLVTFGTVNDETINLLKKREKKDRRYYGLHPPIGGFERKGTKKGFRQGGALGDRKDKINDLIKRMV